jgi:uncharacterized protein
MGINNKIVVAGMMLAALLLPVAGQTSYQATIEAWREKREAGLKNDGGWLTVAGLFWLKEGSNNLGTDRSNDIVLPSGSAPAKVGTLEFHNGKTTLRVAEGVTVLSKGQPVTTLEMQPDVSENPDIINVGDLTMFVIKRGQRYGIRLKDKNSKQRREFTGLHWYPVKESYLITAKFVPYDKPKEIPITSIIGDVDNMPSPGYVTFKLADQEYRLEPVLEDEKLFFIFKDLTSGKSTYPAGRFLYADMPKDGTVTLDFNKAYNPPCAFTAFATCPLPPPQNRLKVAIEAGELTYHVKE